MAPKSFVSSWDLSACTIFIRPGGKGFSFILFAALANDILMSIPLNWFCRKSSSS
jgi:hypothetical protein